MRPVAILPVIYTICRCKTEMARPIGAALVAVGKEHVLSVEATRRMLCSTVLESIFDASVVEELDQSLAKTQRIMDRPGDNRFARKFG